MARRVRAGLLGAILWTGTLSLDLESVLSDLPANTTVINLAGQGLAGAIPENLAMRFPKVAVLNLTSNKLSGSIPSGLGRARGLTLLDLSNNELEGQIPATLGNLAELRHVEFAKNRLSGVVPEEVGSWQKVETIDLSNNRLNGEIPAGLGGLRSLAFLSLVGNELTGTIPAEIGSLGNLTGLYLGKNQLTGGIPAGLGKLRRLRNLGLNENKLNGTIPAALGDLRDLYSLALQSNQLTGAIPAQLGNLRGLALFNLAQNKLSGAIPAELGNLSTTLTIELNNNELSGAIPTELGGWRAAYYVRLQDNHLSGELPEGIGGWSEARGIYLNGNQLTGPLPRSIGGWRVVSNLQLGGNSFSGEIPEEVSGWVWLQRVNFSGNSFAGAVPKTIGSWINARQIDFDFNRLTSLPDEVNSLKMLQVLSMRSNSLEGNLPDLGGLSKLKELTLQGNALVGTGALPPSLKALDLAGNKLSELPEALDDLVELQSLVVTDNLISSWPPRGAYIEVSGFWIEAAEGHGGRPFAWAKLQRLDASGNPLGKLSGTPRSPDIPVLNTFLSSLAYLENLNVLSCRKCNLTGALSKQSLPGIVESRKCEGGMRFCLAPAPELGVPSLQTLDLASNTISEITATPPRSLMRADFSESGLEKLDTSWFNLQGQNVLIELKVSGNPKLRTTVQAPEMPCSGEETVLKADPTAYLPNGKGHECTKLCRGRWAAYVVDSDLDESALCRCRAGYGGSGKDCRACGQDTYSATEAVHGYVRTCRRCPLRSDTGGSIGATSISECKCPSGVFLNASADTCANCPQWPFRATKARGAAHVSACSCSVAYTGLKEFNGVCGCDDGFYMNHLAKRCQKCSNSEHCLWGVDLGRSLWPPQVKAGFWAEPIGDLESFTSNSIWRCTGDGSCYDGGVCASGRWGTACGLCRPGTMGGPDGPCEPCDDDFTQEERRGMLAVGTVLVVIPVVMALHTALTGVHGEGESFGFLMQLQSVRGSLKQMVKHVQSVTVIGGMSVSWPPIAQAFFDMLGAFTLNVPLLFVSGCLEEEPSAVFEMMVKWAMPPTFILLVVMAMPTSWVLARMLRLLMRALESLRCRAGGCLARMLGSLADDVVMSPADVKRILLFSLTMFWSTLVANSFQMLTCIPSPNGRLTVATYPHIQCDFRIPEFRTLALCSVLTILLYLILPLWVLYRGYQRSVECMAGSVTSERGWYSFLFEDFRDGRLLWLLIIMVKDSLFVLIPAAMPGQGSFQLLLVAFTTAGHGLWVTHSAPFNSRSNSLLEAWNAGSAAVLCIYSVGMGYENTAGMDDVEELFEEGADDPIYRGRAVGMAVVQIVTIAIPSAVLLYQLICAVERTRRLLPRKVQPMTQEESEAWLNNFLHETEAEGVKLAKILKRFDESDLHAFRALMEETCATKGECLSGHSASSLVRMANRMRTKELESSGLVEKAPEEKALEEAFPACKEEAVPAYEERAQDGAEEAREDEGPASAEEAPNVSTEDVPRAPVRQVDKPLLVEL